MAHVSGVPIDYLRSMALQQTNRYAMPDEFESIFPLVCTQEFWPRKNKRLGRIQDQGNEVEIV